MSVALAGNTPATFEIKSASLPLVALLLKSPDLSVLEREMATRFGDIPDFFDNDPLIIDLAPLKAALSKKAARPILEPKGDALTGAWLVARGCAPEERVVLFGEAAEESS